MTDYGIRITHVNWASVDGGDDLVGDRTELERKVSRWQLEEDEVDPAIRIVRYEVVPYTPDGLVHLEKCLHAKPCVSWKACAQLVGEQADLRVRQLQKDKIDDNVTLALGRRGLLLGPDVASATVMVERLLERVGMLAKAVIYAHLALDLDMGDGEVTFQCCRGVCGHGPGCPVGDALDLAMRISSLVEADIEPLNRSRALEKQEPIAPGRITGAPGTERYYREAEDLLRRTDLETWREALIRFSEHRGCRDSCAAVYDEHAQRGDDELRAAWCALYENQLLAAEPKA
jgi:hypothetical protein